MTKAAIALFVVGLLLEALGFFGGHTDEMPLVVGILSPAYARLEAAKTKLDKGRTLTPDDRGFAHLANMFLDLLRKENPPERVNAVSVRSIRADGFGMVQAMRQTLAQDTDLKIRLSNGQELGWKMSAIEGRMADLRRTSIFRASVATFLAGVVLQVIAFILQWKQNRAEQVAALDAHKGARQ